MTIRSPFIVVLVAFVLTACAMAGGDPLPRPATGERPAVCALYLTQGNGQTLVEARVQSPLAVTGSYDLQITAADGGTTFRQAGDFRAAPDQAVVLGTASLDGAAAGHAASLTVRSGGQVLACPVVVR